MKKILFVFALLSSLSFLSSCKDNATDTATSTVAARTRTYYIAAEETEWDFAPSGMNMFMGMPFDATDSQYAVHIPTGETPRIGRKCKKAHYVEYTDSTFTTVKPRPAEWEHLGILGPTIRAVVGDSVVVYFKNSTTIHTTIHVHGLEYDQASEGAPYNNGPAGNGNDVPPGGHFMYRYFAREGSGPAPGQQSSLVWLYHSHVPMDESDIFAGLVGSVIVTARNKAKEDGSPNDVDREFVTFFMIFNEANSAYQQDNIDTYLPGFTNPNPDDFDESNLKHSINGMFMGNLPGLVMNKGERVRWYVTSLGEEGGGFHTPHWHGNTVISNGQRTDVVELMPATMEVADMVPDNLGTWAYHCHVADHNLAGMNALYTVK